MYTYPNTISANRRTTDGRPYGIVQQLAASSFLHSRSSFIPSFLHYSIVGASIARSPVTRGVRRGGYTKRLPCARGADEQSESEGLYLMAVCCCFVQSLSHLAVTAPFAQGGLLGVYVTQHHFR